MTNQDNRPKSFLEAVRYFADLNVATEFMAGLRWPEGVACPHCRTQRASYVKTRRIWNCLECKKQFSVKTGSVMEDSPLTLDKWLAAIWLIADCKNGISSHEIARHLNISQKSGWFLLHRIRAAMKAGSFEKLGGEGDDVEVDETAIGGKAKNMHRDRRKAKIQGTGMMNKTIVMGLLRRTQGDQKSKVAVKVVANNRKRTVQREVRTHVAERSNLYTDALLSYQGLDAEYLHRTIDHAVEYAVGSVHTNGIENFWSLLDRAIDGTYVSVDPDHLEKYVDEEAFRFNEREDTPYGRFVKVAQNVAGKRLTWDELVAREEGTKPRRGGGNRHLNARMPVCE